MRKQDFFAFCTTLKPIELKAIGALSRVVHRGASEMIYKTGDSGDTLYIINRGVVEIVEDAPAVAGAGRYLSRGDVLGEVEALTEQPRRNSARTCEDVSLQAFRREDFPELLQRVPTFFRFLCNELACRLAEARVMAAAPAQRLELSGSLANFDLITIYQTIVNSSQTGELSIRNDAGDVISTFYFDSGQPRFGRFDHLTGEEAFWQLFLSEEIPGTFSFSSGTECQELPGAAQISRAAGDMLIHALQWRDEFATLKCDLADGAAIVERHKTHLVAEQVAAASLRPLVEQIWRLSDKRRLPLRSLYPRLHVCEVRIYQAVTALVRSGHFTLSSDELADKVA